MPYFSFSLSASFNLNTLKKLKLNLNQLKSNQTYFCKNTLLWKILNDKKYRSNINFIKFEKRKPVIKIKNKILFCLPPNIGLGDAVEYALAIKAILNSNRFVILGIAFVGQYKEIFQRYFNINNIYEEVITEDLLCSYDTIFHITLEIEELSYQKYDRKNIEELITDYFGVLKFRKLNFQRKYKRRKITIFPISKSPLRTMTVDLLNYIIDFFYKDKIIEIILDNESEISNFIEKNIKNVNVNIIYPKNIKKLLLLIEKIDFGIFMDSGPLHIAKILNKKGILIISSVGSQMLLKDFKSIQVINNNYTSFFCQSPCGLVNVFNYKNVIGCYDSLKIQKKTILKIKNLQSLQRGDLKKKYVNFVSNPVNCLKLINKQEVIKNIQQQLFE